MELEIEKNADPMAELLKKFRSELNKCINQLRRSSFQQEPNYVAALMGKLAGISVSENGLFIQTTIVNDRGPHSAEKEFGADFAIILESPAGLKKAILGQAKGGDIDKLGPKKRKEFFEQCDKILKHSNAFIGLAAPTDQNPIPEIWLGSGPPAAVGRKMNLSDYLVSEFVSCRHGDKRMEFAKAVKVSDLLQLRVVARTT